MQNQDLSQSNQAFFDFDGDWYVGREAAMGPWMPEACHAGPPTAAFAREFERHCAKQILRMTINLLRPVPMIGFRIAVEIEKEGRSSAYLRAQMFDRENNLCAVATSLHQLVSDLGDIPTVTVLPPSKLALDDYAINGNQSPYSVLGRKLFPSTKGFAAAVDIVCSDLSDRYNDGSSEETTQRSIWMRTPRLIVEEPLSPFQSMCPLSDCGNGFTAHATVDEYRYMNTDLTISMHRKPASTWLASTARSHWGPKGYGASYATLFDEHSSVGSAMQTLLIQKS